MESGAPQGHTGDMEPSSPGSSKPRERDHGIGLWGIRTKNGVKVGDVHILRHDVQTSNQCAVGDEALTEAVSWGTSLGEKLVGWIRTHPGHEPVLSTLNVCTLNTIGQTLWSIIPEGGPAVGVVQSWERVGKVVTLTGMRKNMELEGTTGEIDSIMEEQGKVRLQTDCGRRVFVSLDRVGVQEVEHMKGVEDSRTAQQQHQGKETKGHGVPVDHERHRRKETRSEEGQMGGQEETFELWNGVRLVGMRQPELEGHKGVLEEIYKDKVQVLLVGGMRRVKVDKKKVVPEEVEPVAVLPLGFEGWSFLEQIGVGSTPTTEEVKAAYIKWVLRLLPDKNMNNVAKATRLFKRLTSGYEGWKGAPGVAPPRPAEEPPNYQFNPTYFRSNFCNTTSSAGQTAAEEAQPSADNPETKGDGEGFRSFLWRCKRPGRSEHAS